MRIRKPTSGARLRVAAAALRCWCRCALCADSARAQVGEGPGIKISGTLVAHPGISLSAGFDSNMFYASNAFTNDISAPVWYLAVRPGIDIATRGAARGGG